MNSVSPSPSFVYSQSLNRNAMWGQKSRNKNQELLFKKLRLCTCRPRNVKDFEI